MTRFNGPDAATCATDDAINLIEASPSFVNRHQSQNKPTSIAGLARLDLGHEKCNSIFCLLLLAARLLVAIIITTRLLFIYWTEPEFD